MSVEEMEITVVQGNTHILKHNFPQKFLDKKVKNPLIFPLIRAQVLEHKMDFIQETKLLLISLLKWFFLKPILMVL